MLKDPRLYIIDWINQNLQVKGILEMPGKTYGNVEFDAFSEITWDFKSHASTSKSRNIICNDTEAILHTIGDYGYYGIILAVGEAEYNDEDGTFKQWRDALKGKKQVCIRTRKEGWKVKDS